MKQLLLPVKQEITIISHVSSSKAGGDPSTNSHPTHMFQDSGGEEENIGIRSEEPIYKSKKVVECKSVTETSEKQKGIHAKRRNGIKPGTC